MNKLSQSGRLRLAEDTSWPATLIVIVLAVFVSDVVGTVYTLSVVEKIVVTIIAGLVLTGLIKLAPRVYGWFMARDVLKTQLRAYRGQMEALRTTVRTTRGPLWNDEAECERQCVALDQAVLTFLRANAPDHVARFDSDIPRTPERYQPNAPLHVSSWGNFVERRLQALDDIIEKL